VAPVGSGEPAIQTAKTLLDGVWALNQQHSQRTGLFSTSLGGKPAPQHARLETFPRVRIGFWKSRHRRLFGFRRETCLTGATSTFSTFGRKFRAPALAESPKPSLLKIRLVASLPILPPAEPTWLSKRETPEPVERSRSDGRPRIAPTTLPET